MPRPPRAHPATITIRLALAAALSLCAPAVALAGDACPPRMALLSAGRFTLADGSETAVVPALCLDLSEVTAADYAACVARGACPDGALRCGKAATYGDGAKAGHPVNCVSWIEADRYCRALGKRLPTEGEWEWAARGQARGTVYPWGAAPPADRACWDGVGSTLGKGGRNETCAVGAFAKGDSPDGFHDLGGNVREWTASRIGRDRVVRGGSWGDSLPDFLAAGFRGMNKPDERFEITGFRCAAVPAPVDGQDGPLQAAAPVPSPPAPPAPPPGPPSLASPAPSPPAPPAPPPGPPRLARPEQPKPPAPPRLQVLLEIGDIQVAPGAGRR